MHLFERARLIGGEGMVITAELDPTRLSKKIRNSAAKQIREGIYLGYSSRALGVATKYLKHFGGDDLPACGIVWGTRLRVNNCFNYTPEVLDEVKRLLTASAAIYKMKYSADERARIQEYVDSDIEFLRTRDEWRYNTKTLSTYQKEIANELAKYLSNSRTDEQKLRAASIADEVMQDKRIPVFF